MSHRLGRYPLDPDLASNGRLRLPEHRTIGQRPVHNPAWIPQTLWVDALPAGLATGCSPLHRACLAMALAKIGTADTWTEIANHLGLPPALANSIGSVLASWDRAGTWPAIHQHLDQLLQRFRTQPPPINYPRRRVLACDLDLIDRALADTADLHPSPLPDPQLRRVFWEAFTGGDIAYTLDRYAIDPDSPAYAAYRADAADSLDRDRPRLQSMHNRISQLVGENLGPLTWTPAPRAPVRPTPTASASFSTRNPGGATGLAAAPSSVRIVGLERGSHEAHLRSPYSPRSPGIKSGQAYGNSPERTPVGQDERTDDSQSGRPVNG